MPKKTAASRAAIELNRIRWSREKPDPEHFRKIAQIRWSKHREAKNKKPPASESEE